MPVQFRIQHAQHNKQACDLLLTTGGFNDWVVTTAFYTALHFVQGKCFPCTRGGKSIPNILDFAKYTGAKEGRFISKHEATKLIATEEVPAIHTKYRKLYDICMSARYSDYQISLPVAQQARQYMADIEVECT